MRSRFVHLTMNLVLVFCCTVLAAAQTEPAPIADNSFLIEEAYNREAEMIQHINTFRRNRNAEFEYTFAQEIPIFSRRGVRGVFFYLSFEHPF